MHSQKNNPFIGHAGVGAQIELLVQPRISILRETTLSQWVLISSLAIVSLLPAWIIVFDASRVKGGFFAKTVLFVAAITAFPFFVKYILRFYQNRRIEFDHSNQLIRFSSLKDSIEKMIRFQDVSKLEIQISNYYSDGISVKNYTIVLIDHSRQIHELCTSNKEKNIRFIFKEISHFFSTV